MVDSGIWNLLKDTAGEMDIAQITFVMSQEPVKAAYKDMMKSFTSYLFERYKEDFATVQAYQPTIEKYVNAVIASAKNYGEHAQHLEEENMKLRKELEKLRRAGGC